MTAEDSDTSANTPVTTACTDHAMKDRLFAVVMPDTRALFAIRVSKVFAAAGGHRGSEF